LSSQITSLSTQDLEAVLKAEGFDHYGFAELTTPVTIALYEEWLNKGFHGEMQYLERHLPEKRDPQRLMKTAKSAIVVTLDYLPHPEPLDSFPLSEASRIALYAKGADYHFLLKRRLTTVIDGLKKLAPGEDFVCFTDSSPVLERDLAKRAGLGWVGKNTCLLSRDRGSLFFIAEIYTSLALSTAAVEIPDHCGTCTRCIDACPTGALVAPRELDARRCISYLTIEARDLPAKNLRAPIGDWLFGCDICQTVCPWNMKVHGKEELKTAITPLNERGSLIADLRFLLSSSNRALEKAFYGTPLLRTGGSGLKRNAIIVAANLRLVELRPEIEKLAGSEKLKELAEWAIAEFSDC
jgi:epoxyqueuosine reductase